jgi:hypothetical protein
LELLTAHLPHLGRHFLHIGIAARSSDDEFRDLSGWICREDWQDKQREEFGGDTHGREAMT